MSIFRPIQFALLLSCLLFWPGSSAKADAQQWPALPELLDLIRAKSAGMSEAELNRAAVQGLLDQLQSRVEMLPEKGTNEAPATGPLVSRGAVYDSAFAYIRVEQIRSGLKEKILATLDELRSTNSLEGLIIDLRFAQGNEYDPAVEAADPFFAEERTLLRWGEHEGRSTQKEEPIQLPLVVLINHATAGAAEALAAILREGGALLIGSPTAGQAFYFQEFVLSGGHRVRVAIAPVEVAETREPAGQGLKPDITVLVEPKAERAYFEDPFTVAPRLWNIGSTNPVAAHFPPRRRMNEAELIRRQQEAFDFEATGAEVEAELPVVTDPPLARALDFLKGLAIVKKRS